MEHQLAFEDELPLDDMSALESRKRCVLPDRYSFYEYNQSNCCEERIINTDSICELNDFNFKITESQIDCTDLMSQSADFDAKTNMVCNAIKNGSLSQKSPRLIRSNSYILDRPSPLLLAYLKKQENVTDMTTGIAEAKTDLLQDIKGTPNKNMKETFLKNEAQIINEVIENNFTPATTPKKAVEDTESQLKQILDNIPSKYSKEILDLFNNVMSRNSNKEISKAIVAASPCFSESGVNYFEDGSISFGTSSQTLYYSVSGSNDSLNTHTVIENDSYKRSYSQIVAKQLFKNDNKCSKVLIKCLGKMIN